MTNALPKKVQERIKKAVFEKADDYGYMNCGRVESGKFIDMLVEDSEVGQILIEYLPKERIRTYIKDGVLNAYTKKLTKKALTKISPEETIYDIYGENASIIQEGKGKQSGLYILRDQKGTIYVLSGGTVLKWETALRKALEVIANERKLTIDGKVPYVCLKLSMEGQALTEAAKKHISTALGAVGIKAIFCCI